ncbi:hypothetical protein OEZ86_000789 [Tetradesmus obliquus]|nr:hypothetical protein OEZ86_000789 [Tetradesmus obliquus]
MDQYSCDEKAQEAGQVAAGRSSRAARLASLAELEASTAAVRQELQLIEIQNKANAYKDVRDYWAPCTGLSVEVLLQLDAQELQRLGSTMCYLRKHNLPQMIAILQHCKNEGDAVQFLQAGLQQPGFLEALAVLEQYHLPVSSAEHATGTPRELWMTERLQSSSRGPRRLVLGNYLFHSNKLGPDLGDAAAPDMGGAAAAQALGPLRFNARLLPELGPELVMAAAAGPAPALGPNEFDVGLLPELGSELGDAAVPDMAAEDMAAAAMAPAIEPRKFGQGVLTELGAELGGAEALDMAAAAAPAIEPHRFGQGVPPELGPELGGAAAPELPVQGSDASKQQQQQQQAAKKRGWLMCAAGCVAVPLLLGVLCRKMRG